MHHIKLLLAGLILFVIKSSAFAQEIQPVPEAPDSLLPHLSHQQKLSRTSVMMQFLGQAGLPSMALETAFIQYPKASIDMRLAGFLLPSSQQYIFSLAAGLQHQYGAKFSRSIVGIGLNSLFDYRKNGNRNSAGSWELRSISLNYYFMVGYRGQHKHGFFFELDAMLLYGKTGLLDNISAELPNGHHLSPWAGVAFGYRLPSHDQREQWKYESKYLADSYDAQRASDKVAKKERLAKESEEVKKMYSDLNVEGYKVRRSLGPHHIYAEGFGLAAWTINHDLIIKLKKGKNPSLLLSSGIGYTSQLNLPMGFGIGAVNNYLGGFFLLGANLIIAEGLGINPYLGINLQMNAYHGVIVGFKGYAIFNPSNLNHEVLGQMSGIYGMAGFTIGFRPPKKYGYGRY